MISFEKMKDQESLVHDQTPQWQCTLFSLRQEEMFCQLKNNLFYCMYGERVRNKKIPFYADRKISKDQHTQFYP